VYAFLRPTEVVDWEHPLVRERAESLLREAEGEPLRCAEIAFEWVRDRIPHSFDGFYGERVACRASEVIEAGTGICYAKSHLLAALLRANGIPSGFCYQRCRWDEGGFCLHGLNAVHLPEFGWYRIDARGNKPGVDARFAPPVERLAFEWKDEGERLFPDILPEPLPAVVAALRAAPTVDALRGMLPDAETLS
jgi:transglutaminase-like putative cysteine protease